ncbi:MAG: proteic killer suppression protein [Planctomycetota bacterium]
MIKQFKHGGLEKYFLRGTKSGIQAKHANRIRLILGRLHVSTQPQDMNLPGLALHELRGRRKGTWSVKVSGNWRITFSFDGLDAIEVNYEDYH